jgi:hypothetical protein
MRLFIFLFLFGIGELCAQANYADCKNAIILCDNREVFVLNLPNAGVDKSEIGYTSCSQRLGETNSAWIKWEIGSSGSLGFVLRPNHEKDDVDFVLYQLEGDLTTCAVKREIRCMASGLDIGGTLERNVYCQGATGITDYGSGITERDGCSDENDSFLDMIKVKKGDKFLLFVNNLGSRRGFSIRFNGDAEIGTPDALKDVNQTDMSTLSTLKEVMGVTHAINLNTKATSTQFTHPILTTWPGNNDLHAFVGCFDRAKQIVQEADVKPRLDVTAFPNPCREATQLKLTVDRPQIVTMSAYDIFGRFLLNNEYALLSGENLVTVPLGDLGNGAVFFRLKGEGKEKSVMVMKISD